MFPLWIEPLDGRYLCTGDRANRCNAGTGSASLHMHGACATKADTAAKLGSCKAQLVADNPEQRRFIWAMHRNSVAIKIECRHDRTAPVSSVIAISPAAYGWKLPFSPTPAKAAAGCVFDADKLRAWRPRHRSMRRHKPASPNPAHLLCSRLP